MNMVFVWFGLFIVFLVAELATSLALVTVWFCVGALAAMLAAYLGAGFFPQLVIFIAVSIAMIYFTKPFIKKVLRVKHEPMNADKIIGAVCPVVETIDNTESKGAVRYEGKIWTARNTETDAIIDKGEKVKVQRISGVTVYVKKIGQE